MPNMYGGGGGSLYRGRYAGTPRVAPEEKKKPGTSNFQWVMDRLSTPQYASAALADMVVRTATGKPLKGGAGPGAMAKGVGRVITGRDRWSYSDVLADAGVKNKWAKGVGGLAGDIFLDPSTYVGTGLAKVPGAAAKTAKLVTVGEDVVKAAKVSEDISRGAKLSRRIARIGRGAPEVQQVARAGEVLRQAEPAHKGLLQTLLRTGRKVGPEEVAASKAAEEVLQGTAHVMKDAPPVGSLGNLTGKAITGGTKGRTGVSAIEAAAHSPSLFPDLIEPVVRSSRAAPAIPKTVAAIADVGAKVRAAPALEAAIEFGKKAPQYEKTVADGAKNAVELKMFGKSVARSTKLYDAGAKVLGPVGATKPAQLLSKTFRTGHDLLPEVHDLQRVSVGKGRQVVAEKAKEVEKVWHGLDKTEQTIGYHVIQGTKDDAGKALHTMDELSPEAQKAVQWTQRELGAIHGMESGGAALPGMGGAGAKFEDIAKWKGGAVHTRAPHAFVAHYDKAMRKQAFKEFTDTVAHRFPNNPEVMASLKRSRDIFGVEGHVSAQWTHYIDNAMTHWKRWNTTYRPGFHTRNMLGDHFNAYLAGTRGDRFKDSAKILFSKGEGKGGTVKIGGKHYSFQDVRDLYTKGGLHTSYVETEVAGGSQRKLAKALTTAGDKREEYTRMATFIDSLDKGMKKGMSEKSAIEYAAGRVRKYHFDYTDLTPFERTLKKFIPFYTYTRKELPVLLEHTLTSPAKMTVPGKVGRGIEGMLGVEHDPNNPTPGIKGLLPEYMRSQQLIQRGNNKVFKPGLPTDMLSQLFNPSEFIKQQAGNITPIIKAPVEISTGKSFPLGYSMKKKGTSQKEMLLRYAMSYGPYGNLARDSKSPISERVRNILTGAGEGTVRQPTSKSKSKGRSSSTRPKKSIYQKGR